MWSNLAAAMARLAQILLVVATSGNTVSGEDRCAFAELNCSAFAQTFSCADERLSLVFSIGENRSKTLSMSMKFRCTSVLPDSTIKFEEFDPGSERTLAAWLRHASRTIGCSNMAYSGGRVSTK